MFSDHNGKKELEKNAEFPITSQLIQFIKKKRFCREYLESTKGQTDDNISIENAEVSNLIENTVRKFPSGNKNLKGEENPTDNNESVNNNDNSNDDNPEISRQDDEPTNYDSQVPNNDQLVNDSDPSDPSEPSDSDDDSDDDHHRHNRKPPLKKTPVGDNSKVNRVRGSKSNKKKIIPFNRGLYKDLPSFSGKYLDFPEFYDLYTEAVENTTLSESLKLNYLKKRLDKDSLALIRNYTGREYYEALQVLLDKFTSLAGVITHINQQTKDLPTVKHSHDEETIEMIVEELRSISSLFKTYKLNKGFEIEIFKDFYCKVPEWMSEQFMKRLGNKAPTLKDYLRCLDRSMTTLRTQILYNPEGFDKKNCKFESKLTNDPNDQKYHANIERNNQEEQNGLNSTEFCDDQDQYHSDDFEYNEQDYFSDSIQDEQTEMNQCESDEQGYEDQSNEQNFENSYDERDQLFSEKEQEQQSLDDFGQYDEEYDQDYDEEYDQNQEFDEIDERLEIPCLKCHETTHSLLYCHLIGAVERFDIVKDCDLCHVCLKANHTTQDCRSSYRCVKCKDKHSSFVCTNFLNRFLSYPPMQTGSISCVELETD